ncbi:uncharacterized protein N7458_005665 [Penicillium daleae]|uniref:Uncharacterized protein n=1 Tax=Penicillium daleae TaxID=63821 RepID=A0AAD6C8W0_9EURO|nr:uncharacterized protein N7458_005665 [Penicillium daleae]KAJ5454709.1 hypothetical protein N7458_005665 [Penicillium daleae]
MSVTYLVPPETPGIPRDIPTPMPLPVRFEDCRKRKADVDWEYGIGWVEEEMEKRAAADIVKRRKVMTP